jgi:hypothetical protein
VSRSVIETVYHSRLERAYVPLAALLAFYADDEGRRVFPGADTLADSLNVSDSTIRHNLRALLVRGIILRDGYHGHVRKFRFDLERLRAYRPMPASRAARNSGNARENGHATLPSTATPRSPIPPDQPCRVQPETLPPAANYPAVCGQEPCRAQPLVIFNDQQDHHEQTGASAPGCAEEIPTTTKSGDFAPVGDVFATIAKRALRLAVGDKDESATNLMKHFRKVCTEDGVVCDPDQIQPAIDAALTSRDREKRKVFELVRTIGRAPRRTVEGR